MKQGRVFEPKNITAQFTFSKFIMLKMFLAAAGSSCLSIVLVSMLFPKQFQVCFCSFVQRVPVLPLFLVNFLVIKAARRRYTGFNGVYQGVFTGSSLLGTW